MTLGHLSSGARLHTCARSVRYISKFRMYRQPTQVQLMRGDFLETVLYWAGVVSDRFGAMAEKKVSQHFCVRVSLCVPQPVH